MSGIYATHTPPYVAQGKKKQEVTEINTKLVIIMFWGGEQPVRAKYQSCTRSQPASTCSHTDRLAEKCIDHFHQCVPVINKRMIVTDTRAIHL